MRWGLEQNAEVERMWNEGATQAAIADHFGVSFSAISGRLIRLNLQPRGLRKPLVLAEDHKALASARTLFPSRVVDAGENPLKPGTYARKLGAVVTKGRWKGFPIYSLTLEERATCPKDCALYRSCYGNGMHLAKRMEHGELLFARLYDQLERLAERHRKGFVVRLHVLGDFHSTDYVEFWRLALKEYFALRIFGYTAWQVGTPIGSAIRRLRHEHPARFKVRHSGARKGYRTSVVDHEDAVPADAILCPVERGLTKNCGTCGLCWGTERAIAFVRH